MRRCLPLVAAVLAVSVPAVALDMPARKPGLWEIKMTMEGRSLPPQVMQHCIDAATDKQMNTLGSAVSKDKCSRQDVTNVGGKIVVDSVCRFGAATTTSHGEVTGSFDSAYTVKVTSKHDGALMPGMPAGGTTNMTIEAKWLGACKTDQRPGDIVMANGMKMNVNDMQKLQALQPGATAPVR
jgi:hypothetical protein